MEVFALLVASKYGVAALGTVTVAISILVSTFSVLVYKSGQRGVHASNNR